MNRIRFRWSLRTFLVACAVVSCAVGGLVMRIHWRKQLFAQLESIGNQPESTLRVDYEVEGRWLGLFGLDFSLSQGPTKRRWWFDPSIHRYIRSMTLYVADGPQTDCESVLRHRESLRGLAELQLVGIGQESELHFPASVASLPDVRLLKLDNIELSRKDIESISAMPDLEILHLRRCRFQMEDLVGLQGSKHLAWLSFHQPCDPPTLQKVRDSLVGVYVSPFSAETASK